MKRLLVALILVMVVLPSAAWSSTPPDPTFDQPYTNGVASGWTSYMMAWAPSPEYFYSWSQTSGSHSGSSAQQIETSGEGGVYGVFETMEGFDYTISVWVKGSWAGGAFAALDWNGGVDPNAILWNGWLVNSLADQWEQFTWTGTAPGTQVTLFLDAYAGVVQFDELTGIGEVVPEPGTLAALGTGLIGLLGVIRRRK